MDIPSQLYLMRDIMQDIPQAPRMNLRSDAVQKEAQSTTQMVWLVRLTVNSTSAITTCNVKEGVMQWTTKHE